MRFCALFLSPQVQLESRQGRNSFAEEMSMAQKQVSPTAFLFLLHHHPYFPDWKINDSTTQI